MWCKRYNYLSPSIASLLHRKCWRASVTINFSAMSSLRVFDTIRGAILILMRVVWLIPAAVCNQISCFFCVRVSQYVNLSRRKSFKATFINDKYNFFQQATVRSVYTLSLAWHFAGSNRLASQPNLKNLFICIPLARGRCYPRDKVLRNDGDFSIILNMELLTCKMMLELPLAPNQCWY